LGLIDLLIDCFIEFVIITTFSVELKEGAAICCPVELTIITTAAVAEIKASKIFVQ
jgi:hypothetical protein